MSDSSLDHLADQAAFDHAAEIEAAERDWVEIMVRKASRLAGYGSLAAAVIGIAYLAIR